MAPFLQVHPDGLFLHVKVQPRASKDEISDVLGNELKIKVTAPPVDSAANEALVRFLAKTLDCRATPFQLVRGHTSRHKVLLLQKLDAASVLQRLQAGRSK